MKVENYYYNDFTEENYERLIKIISNKYITISYDYEEIMNNKNNILLRHDIDYSINRSLKLAQIEQKNGVKSTFFLHIHNEAYNIFEAGQYEIVKRIISMGHDIGLHFDHGFYKNITNNKSEIENWARYEKELLERLYGISIKAVSFHNPEATSVLEVKNRTYAGMVNAYSKDIADRYKYCSDSNGYWRFERLEELLEKGYEKLHVLLHPAWWVPKTMSPYERIERCVYGRASNYLKQYCEFLNECGRINVGYSSENEDI